MLKSVRFLIFEEEQRVKICPVGCRIYFLYASFKLRNQKRDFCVKSYSLVSLKRLFSFLRECVSFSYDATAAKCYHFKVSRERKICLRFQLCLQKKPSYRKFHVLVVQRRQRNPTEKRKQCTSCMCRVMFCLLKKAIA